MKEKIVFFSLVATVVFMRSACVLGADSRVKLVDPNKIRAHKATRFIGHVFWPSDELVSEKNISKSLISQDMQEFKKTLAQVLRPGYAPASEIIDANAVAVEGLAPEDANDYILLRYTRNGQQIQIQDGKALWVTVFPNNEANEQHFNVSQYVITVAYQVLNIPKSDKNAGEPNIYTATLDIGGSKWGSIVYRTSFPPPRFWYSHMSWWSDGTNVMFLIGKGSGGDTAARRPRAAAPPNATKPRKFQKQR